ncbi:MAG: type II toxin-antitoxin system PemK/MazF family toxin [Beijerinckiaceae bacterium]|nr:type II toxin-antitoxin system PemK/MazF family toxin [Beijerinckiaceae bacterium]
MVRRGDIWLATLDPTISSEIRKTRPCLVVSPPDIHDHLRTVVVAPMTSKGRPAPYRVPIRFDGKDGLILTEQVRALDRKRLVKRLGSAPPSLLAEVLEIIRETYEE